MNLFQRKNEKETCKEVAEVDEIRSKNTEEITDNALACFGWKSAKIEKWLKKLAKWWYRGISLFWFFVGVLTFAPIIFIRDKIDVVFKNRKKSLIMAVLIYTIIFVLAIILFILNNKPTV